MGAARWGSIVLAGVVIASSSVAFAKDYDRDDDRAVQVAVQRPPYDVYRDDRRDRDDRDYRRDRDDRDYRDRRDPRVREVAVNNGYNDGYQKGLEDGRDRHSFDPTRHKWYRNANRNYDSRYGPKAEYENFYRDGFRRGYDNGYRDGDRRDNRRSNRFPFPY